MKARDYIQQDFEPSMFIKREKACSFKWGVLAGIGLSVALFFLGMFISTLIYV